LTIRRRIFNAVVFDCRVFMVGYVVRHGLVPDFIKVEVSARKVFGKLLAKDERIKLEVST